MSEERYDNEAMVRQLRRAWTDRHGPGGIPDDKLDDLKHTFRAIETCVNNGDQEPLSCPTIAERAVRVLWYRQAIEWAQDGMTKAYQR